MSVEKPPNRSSDRSNFLRRPACPRSPHRVNAKSCIRQKTLLARSTYPGGLPPPVAVLKSVLSTIKKPVTLLDITTLSLLRKDGHPSIYGLFGSKEMDCSHWCLSGRKDGPIISSKQKKRILDMKSEAINVHCLYHALQMRNLVPNLKLLPLSSTKSLIFDKFKDDMSLGLKLGMNLTLLKPH